MKRNELKRILPLAIVTVMCVAVTACSQGTANATDNETTVISEDSVSEDTEAKTKVEKRMGKGFIRFI
ncbi:hypothetical protein [Butyrivibrio sp. WCD3002]|uniref:hypothetical protein n=1 Tax=Butyrivibrio sp. WCD3002 TaxID=1280676 RepID=UPI0004116708|nr:hypothetical protein [Butyrivibrio sp. WCD3002]